MTTPWEIEAQCVVGRSPGAADSDLQLRVVPGAPTSFAQLVRGAEAECIWELLSVTPLPEHSSKTEEVYVRGNDLIARYAESSGDQFAYGLYWQWLERSAKVDWGLELWMSVQTGLLDASPVLAVSSKSLSSGQWEVYQHRTLSGDCLPDAAPRGPAAMVCRSDVATAVWLVEPTDQVHVQLQSPLDANQQTLRVFGHFMEKGVIRRARMRVHFAARVMGQDEIAELYHQFANSPLPLTA
ncbi:hypothetical protein [Aureliella helgolandensis]|uniref:Uncharacterized protein n=1 Tax=Aureliella helgolandensis TaxID=2527968 RepID=A0A518G8S9_9BACT|nr:hypothetical protein [Aureliella helgolandensis]QDV25008.1 hypothetical protein Q31a_33300 [Aureliella helgolandensis]